MSTKSTDAGQLVIRSFSKKSNSYSTWAGFQKEAASRLSGYLPDQINGPVLETGAGTGLFTHFLIRKYPGIPILITDASEEMLLACRRELELTHKGQNGNNKDSDVINSIPPHSFLQNGDRTLIPIDNRYTSVKSPKHELRFFVYNPEKEGPYPLKHDLVVSALTAQWFGDFRSGISALANSVTDGGRIIISYLTNSSFPEWANKCTELDIPFTANRLPKAGSGRNVLKSLGFEVNSEHISIAIRYPSAIDFFRSLKMTGASAQLGGIRNRATDMKRLITAIDQSDGLLHQPKNITITYGLDVVTGYRKVASDRDDQK